MGKPGKKAGNNMLPPTHTGRKVDSSKGHLRDQRTIRRLKMYNSKIKRDEKGHIVQGSVLAASDRVETSMARVAPDRRWFGNTRVIGQEALQQFRTEMSTKMRDPYSIVIKQSKLPLSLLEEPVEKSKISHEKMTWDKTFGEKSTRKRVRLATDSLSSLKERSETLGTTYETTGHLKDRKAEANLEREADNDEITNRSLFKKGQSNRIWGELYKVIDSADVILYVLDARDPNGTRSAFIEHYMKTEKKFKHFVFVLNKVDLIPLWATARWVQQLSKDFPTVAFHASVTHPFGKGNLISLLRQFSRLHSVMNRGKKKAPISIGVIGYPNVGKSSLINTLKRKAVCKVAPIPGETKVWQYVALTRSIFLIDCPGVVYDREGNSDVQAVLKGVVRVERLGDSDKTQVIDEVLKSVKPADIIATYKVRPYVDSRDFLSQLALNRGKLLPGGVPDTDAVARSVLYDWQRGKVPWFIPPPSSENAAEDAALQAQTPEQLIHTIEQTCALTLDGDQLTTGGAGSSGKPLVDAELDSNDDDDDLAAEDDDEPETAAKATKTRRTEKAGAVAAAAAPAKKGKQKAAITVAPKAAAARGAAARRPAAAATDDDSWNEFAGGAKRK